MMLGGVRRESMARMLETMLAFTRAVSHNTSRETLKSDWQVQMIFEAHRPR